MIQVQFGQIKYIYERINYILIDYTADLFPVYFRTDKKNGKRNPLKDI